VVKASVSVFALIEGSAQRHAFGSLYRAALASAA
jgi:hypothetical protein